MSRKWTRACFRIRSATPQTRPTRASVPAEEAASARRRTALRWGVAGVLAPPLTVPPHELGHYLVYAWLGLPDVALHYGSVSWTGSSAFWDAIGQGDHAAAAAIAPVSGVATAYAMGLVATYLVVLACCWLSVKWRPHPLLVAVGYLSSFRITASLAVLVLPWFGVTVRSTCDECQLSILTGVPVAVLTLPGLVSLVGAGIWPARCFPRRESTRRRSLTGARIRCGLGGLRSTPRPTCAALRVGVEDGVGQPVGLLVVHRDEDLARLHRAGDERGGGDAAAARLDVDRCRWWRRRGPDGEAGIRGALPDFLGNPRRRAMATAVRPARQGNLQAVLDEQWHLLWDQVSWSEDPRPLKLHATGTLESPNRTSLPGGGIVGVLGKQPKG